MHIINIAAGMLAMLLVVNAAPTASPGMLSLVLAEPALM